MASDPLLGPMKVSLNKKKFELINGVLWHKKEIKRAKKLPGTAFGDAEVAAKAAVAAAATGAGGASAFEAADEGIGNINEAYNPQKSEFDLDTRFQLCRSVGVECIQVRGCGRNLTPSASTPRLPPFAG